VEGDLSSSNYLQMAHTVSTDLKEFLEIRMLEQDTDEDYRKAFTSSAEAYRYYIEGMDKILSNDYDPAIALFKKALETDSTFTLAAFYIAYSNSFMWPQRQDLARIWIKKAHSMKENLPVRYQYWLETWYALFFDKDLQKVLDYSELVDRSGIDSKLLWFDLAATYSSFCKMPEKAIEYYERIEEITLEQGYPWEYELYYEFYGRVLHETGNHQKEHEIYDQGLKMFPNLINQREIYYFKTVCALSRDDTIQAAQWLDSYLSVKKELNETADNIAFWVGMIHELGGKPRKAVAYLRDALALNPEADGYRLNLARILIENEIDMQEGMETIRELDEKYPDRHSVLNVLGWGLHLQGRDEEALPLLERALELREELDIRTQQMIQEVRKALALSPA
jgi:tetratricopeptide (TPR) repeat protein